MGSNLDLCHFLFFEKSVHKHATLRVAWMNVLHTWFIRVRTMYRHVHTLYIDSTYGMHIPLWCVLLCYGMNCSCVMYVQLITNAMVQDSLILYRQCSYRDIHAKNGYARWGYVQCHDMYIHGTYAYLQCTDMYIRCTWVLHMVCIYHCGVFSCVLAWTAHVLCM